MGFVSFTCVLIHVINKKIHSIIEFLFTITAHNNILIILIIFNQDNKHFKSIAPQILKQLSF